MANPDAGEDFPSDAELDAAMAWHRANPETLEERASRIAEAYTWDSPELRERIYRVSLAVLQAIAEASRPGPAPK